MEGKQSEYARLLAQIDKQNRAAKAGMSDFAAVARHESITAKMTQGGESVLLLFGKGYYEEGIALWEKFVDEQGGAAIS